MRGEQEIMFQTIKTEGYVINMTPMSFNNKNTGEVRQMTKISYVVNAPSSELFKGGAVLTAYSSGKAFNVLEKILMQKAELTIEQRPTENGSKYHIISVNGISLKD